MHDEKEIGEIKRKLNNIEQHIINLILPLQTLNKLDHFTKNPIEINDRNLIKTLNMFRESVCDFINLIKSSELNKNIESIHVLLNDFRNTVEAHNNTISEIKYIGKKVNEIKEELKEIKKNGVKNVVEVKVIGEQKDKEFINGITKQMAFNKIKTVLKPIETQIFFKTWGLGCEKQSYVQLSKEFNYSAGYLGSIGRKALRKVMMKIPCEYIEATENETLILNQKEWNL